jgi:hypothetical protein
VEEEQVDEELVPVEGEPDLAADEGEPRAELGQGVLEAFGQGSLDGTLPGPLGQVQEVEDVGVLDDLLRLVGIDGVQVVGEVAGGGPDASVQAGGDVVLQDLPGPAVGLTPFRGHPDVSLRGWPGRMSLCQGVSSGSGTRRRIGGRLRIW